MARLRFEVQREVRMPCRACGQFGHNVRTCEAVGQRKRMREDPDSEVRDLWYRRHFASVDVLHRVFCPCGGTHLSFGTLEGSRSWHTHMQSERHMRWVMGDDWHEPPPLPSPPPPQPTPMPPVKCATAPQARMSRMILVARPPGMTMGQTMVLSNGTTNFAQRGVGFFTAAPRVAAAPLAVVGPLRA